MTEVDIKKSLEETVGWELFDNKVIKKKFKFEDFKSALHFVNQVGKIAEEEKHHPDIEIFNWNNVRISLTTHSINGLSIQDFSLAAQIDFIYKNK